MKNIEYPLQKITPEGISTLNSYFAELNSMLNELKINNAYSIISEIETGILEEIKVNDKKSDVTEILQIIERIGHPESLADHYIPKHEDITIQEKTNKLTKNSSGIINQVLLYIALFLPNIVLILLLPLIVMFEVSFVYIAVAIFIVIEMIDGVYNVFNGIAYLGIWNRNLFRGNVYGIFLSTILSKFESTLYNGFYFGGYDRTLNFVLAHCFSTFIILEFTIYYRENVSQFYPLSYLPNKSTDIFQFKSLLIFCTIILSVFSLNLYENRTIYWINNSDYQNISINSYLIPNLFLTISLLLILISRSSLDIRLFGSVFALLIFYSQSTPVYLIYFTGFNSLILVLIALRNSKFILRRIIIRYQEEIKAMEAKS
ncbi:MAG: DUF1700 domain-containing protein [Candidatus Heimdallarchaeota archaeon]|nr:DUF1700 domain-containing protein [Candidatus Heimdallarchaeota archaeon]MDH5645380.1 DUF1700 domain-containing protein [Candidatus Heimdallarchaeota archaeon]